MIWPFHRFRPSRQSRQDLTPHLCRLLEEQNALLRELSSALGRPSVVPRVQAELPRIRAPYVVRTEKDVMRVTREDRLTDQMKRQQDEMATWRIPVNGPDFEPTPKSSGLTPSDISPERGRDTPSPRPPGPP